MKFLDQCSLKVKAGRGGDGVISFRREFRVDKGGPDGGDGGDGGSIYFVGDPGMGTLFKLRYLREVVAPEGEKGGRKNQYGAGGDDVYIKVPFGTLVYDGERLMFDITDATPRLIAKGGRGGRGNLKFKTIRNTAPRLSENGAPGETKTLDLELKVLADVGLVGKPSAGKSTMLSLLTNAKPKIADYPFTTLVPQLGITEIDENSFVLVDLPGLIAGAAAGKGLGHDFLRHIERCRTIAYVIDFGSPEKDPIDDYETLVNELSTYAKSLTERAGLIIANKQDLPDFADHLMRFKKRYPDLEVITISAASVSRHDESVNSLKRRLFRLYNSYRDEPVLVIPEPKEVTIKLVEQVVVKRPFSGLYEVSGELVRHHYDRIPISSYDNLARFNAVMNRIGVWDKLKEKGIKNGDIVRIFEYEFSWGSEDE